MSNCKINKLIIPPGVAKGFLRDNLEVFCFSILMILFFKTFIGQQFTIPSASMRNTLMIGDHLLVNKFIFAVPQWSWERNLMPMRMPNRGDIVVFRYPLDRDTDYVKRCVAIPGDTIEIKNKRLFINNNLITGSWEYHNINHIDGPISGPWPMTRNAGMLDINASPFASMWPFVNNDYTKNVIHPHHILTGGFRDNMGPITVPYGCIFAMGDNRDNSADSRYWGFVPIDHLRGRPFMIWWSYREGGNDDTNAIVPEGPKDILMNFVDGVRYFFVRTRWERTGYMPR